MIERLTSQSSLVCLPNKPTRPLVGQSHGTRPATGAALHLVKKAGNGEGVRRQPIELVELLHVTIGTLPIIRRAILALTQFDDGFAGYTQASPCDAQP